MKTQIALMLVTAALWGSIAAGQEKLPPSNVDYSGFVVMTDEAQKHREGRLVDLATFQQLAAMDDTILLDVRSESAYKRKHLKGAVHLNFSEFTEEKLARVIPSKETRILIYCNNNIAGDNLQFAPKIASLALNVPTFINLYGYGYRNVYELRDLVPADHPRLVFEGTSVKPRVAGKR